jgi:N-acetylmuramoyl-L-alanine amidase CwlA
MSKSGITGAIGDSIAKFFTGKDITTKIVDMLKLFATDGAIANALNNIKIKSFEKLKALQSVAKNIGSMGESLKQAATNTAHIVTANITEESVNKIIKIMGLFEKAKISSATLEKITLVSKAIKPLANAMNSMSKNNLNDSVSKFFTGKDTGDKITSMLKLFSADGAIAKALNAIKFEGFEKLETIKTIAKSINSIGKSLKQAATNTGNTVAANITKALNAKLNPLPIIQKLSAGLIASVGQKGLGAGKLIGNNIISGVKNAIKNAKTPTIIVKTIAISPSGKHITVPGFASGGIVSKPTLAMVGEGKEPEAITPLSKLSKMISQNDKNRMTFPTNITLIDEDGSILTKTKVVIDDKIVKNNWVKLGVI